MTNRITWRHFDMVRAMERAGSRHLSVTELAEAACLAPGSVVTYISHLRRQYGYTVIDGTPTRGYRLDEWPGREVPRDGRRQGVRREMFQAARQRPAFDTSEGVVVTPAGKALGL